MYSHTVYYSAGRAGIPKALAIYIVGTVHSTHAIYNVLTSSGINNTSI